MHGASTAGKQQRTGTLPPCCFALGRAKSQISHLCFMSRPQLQVLTCCCLAVSSCLAETSWGHKIVSCCVSCSHLARASCCV